MLNFYWTPITVVNILVITLNLILEFSYMHYITNNKERYAIKKLQVLWNKYMNKTQIISSLKNN
jgi:hypothetical protein